MIFIVVKWSIKPEHADAWPEISGPFTEATRAEPGNLFFDWSRSLDDPTNYILVEAFADGEAGGAHVGSEHFKVAMDELGQYVGARPAIISTEISGTDDWSELGELNLP